MVKSSRISARRGQKRKRVGVTLSGGQLDIRRNHRDLSSAQKTAFVNAVLALKNNVDSVLHPGAQNRYDDFVGVHKNAMISGPAMIMPMPHGGPLFYPWHRILLRQFELALQAAANDTSITLPYWDWDFSGSSNPFTTDFLGGDGDPAQGGRVSPLARSPTRAASFRSDF